MKITELLAKHLRDVHFGGNWTTSNLKNNLEDVTWEMATKEVYGLNTIAELLYHTHYYIAAVGKVLQGEALTAKDAHSFDHPAINNEEDWMQLQESVWTAVTILADLVEQMPEEQLWAPMTDEKYGTWYRNIQGITEHTHYHLGQIAILKKIIVTDTL